MNTSARATIASGLLTTVFLAFPGFASALTSSVQTVQLLPPGGNSCVQPSISSVTPFIFDGNLNSYDVIVADTSYVAVLSTVGGTSVPLRYISRFSDIGGGTKVHVDVDATPVAAGLPITLTMLASPTGMPTCLSVVSFNVSGNGQVTGVQTAPATPKPTVSKPAPVKTPETTPEVPSAVVTPTTTAGETPVVAATFSERLHNICANSGSLQLWFLLLAIYIVIVALTALAQPPLSEKSVAIPLGLILVPLVLLIGFWFFAESCRGAAWVPTVTLLIAIAGLLGAFREQDSKQLVIPLPAAAKKPEHKTSTALLARPTTQEKPKK